LGPGSYPVLALTTEAWIRELQLKGLSEYSPNAQIEKKMRSLGLIYILKILIDFLFNAKKNKAN